MLKFIVGEVTAFQYPKTNRIDAAPEWRERTILVTRIRRLSIRPLRIETVQERPLKKRGEVLIYGIDQETGNERMFYLSAMRGYDSDVGLQLVAVDGLNPGDDPEPLGRCFALEPSELTVLNETLLRLRKSLKLPSNYSLAIMPVEVQRD